MNFSVLCLFVPILTVALSACGGGSGAANVTVPGAPTVTVPGAPTVTVPGAPTALVATAGNASASLAFTAPASNGGAAITNYTATCSASGMAAVTASSLSSPIVVSSLSNGSSYSCTVIASNSAGNSAASSAAMLLPAAAVASIKLFISGHSLTDNPLPDYIDSVAQSLSTSLAGWDQQNITGSPIRARTRGNDINASSFPGYSSGKNRVGSGMDVVEEFRRPANGQRYDTLILTEGHSLIDNLIWEDTVRYVRHFHERLIEGNPQASTYLYHSWLDVPYKSNPRSWIAYERTVAPAWQCVASRINQSLLTENRSDRVIYLPTGLALATLVERATQGTVAGITGSTVTDTVNRIFSDDVHLTRLGIYYMALVNYASVHRRSPVGAVAPSDSGVTATQALSLQNIAWQVVSDHYSTFVPPDLAQCRTTMRDSICSAYWTFKNRPDQITGCQSHFTGTTQNNPFFFNATTDRSYWLPAP